MSDFTDWQFQNMNGDEALAYAPRRWNPRDPRAMTFPHLMNAIRYWSRNSAPQSSDYVRRLEAELNRRSEQAS